jgi:hypothetical protein
MHLLTNPFAHSTQKLALSAIALLWSFAANVQAQPAENLFTIARSKNANVVRYDIQRGPDGLLNPAQPINAYWLMLAENGRREGLSWMERELAYGFSISRVTPSGFSLRLLAFKQREIQVHHDGVSYRARVVIAGKSATLNRIFVRADEGGGLLPHVRYVELQGIADGGAPVTERIPAS